MPETGYENLLEYMEILEKTNQQLSLWYNPYGLMIASLAVLFTAAAIVTAFAIYRQNRGYKKAFEKDRERFTKGLDSLNKEYQVFIRKQTDLMKDRQKKADEIDNKIDEIIKKYEEKLKKVSGKQKQKIEDAIASLEREKIALQSNMNTPSFYTHTTKPVKLTSVGCNSYPLSTFSPGTINTMSTTTFGGNHTCSNCGLIFNIERCDPLLTTSASQILLARCPRCGGQDVIQ